MWRPKQGERQWCQSRWWRSRQERWPCRSSRMWRQMQRWRGRPQQSTVRTPSCETVTKQWTPRVVWIKVRFKPLWEQVPRQGTKGWHPHHWKRQSGRCQCKPCSQMKKCPRQGPAWGTVGRMRWLRLHPSRLTLWSWLSFVWTYWTRKQSFNTRCCHNHTLKM